MVMKDAAQKEKLRFWWGEAKVLARDYGLAILGATLLALWIRGSFFEAYRIPNDAMSPTLQAGDTIFVSKVSKKPKRGDVVVFSGKEDERKDYIKRVVGIPGDTIGLREGRLILNGNERTVAAVDEDLPSICGHERLDSRVYPVCWDPPVFQDFDDFKVPDKHVFVIGDLRTETLDNRGMRNWGLIPVSSLKGKALWIWLSIHPQLENSDSGWFSRIRFERMFQRI